MTYLLLWNNDNYGNYLKDTIDNSSDLIIGQGDFDKITDFNKYSKIIVLAELEWDGKNWWDYYGLELTCELRRDKRIKKPIIISSIFPLNQLMNMNPILTVHPFIRIPFTTVGLINVLNQYQDWDEHKLNTNVDLFCKVNNIIKKILGHDCKELINYNGRQQNINWTKLQEEYEKIEALTRYQTNFKYDIENMKKILSDAIKKEDINKLNQVVELKNEILRKLQNKTI